MKLYAKRRAAHLMWTAAAGILLGVALGAAEIVTFAGALLAGVALARGLALISVARARSAGFEMLWKTGERTRRARRLSPVQLSAELRNRDTLPTRFRRLSAMHSPLLEVRVTPEEGEIPPGERLIVNLEVKALRVGYHGIHGLCLETIRAPGLYGVPLSFSNPLVLEVLPRALTPRTLGARGERSRHHAPDGGGGALLGDGPEFRELREHRPGDPFRRIAWKASARRGRLLVVEKELEQREIVWLLIDASVDSFCGPPGRAGIDLAIDTAQRTIEGHLARGDVVGLIVAGAQKASIVPLGRGPSHAARLVSTLSFDCHTGHADRSDWDEHDVVRRVIEHARGIDERAVALHSDDRDALVELAAKLQRDAPVDPELPYARTPGEQILRKYLLAFGIHPPVRSTSDRHTVERRLAAHLSEVRAKRPRPALIYLFGKAPTLETPRELLESLGACIRARTEVRFVPQVEHLTEPLEAARIQERIAHDALRARLGLQNEEGLRRLRGLGVVVVADRALTYAPERSTSARSTTS